MWLFIFAPLIFVWLCIMMYAYIEGDILKSRKTKLNPNSLTQEDQERAFNDWYRKEIAIMYRMKQESLAKNEVEVKPRIVDKHRKVSFDL